MNGVRRSGRCTVAANRWLRVAAGVLVAGSLSLPAALPAAGAQLLEAKEEPAQLLTPWSPEQQVDFIQHDGFYRRENVPILVGIESAAEEAVRRFGCGDKKPSSVAKAVLVLGRAPHTADIENAQRLVETFVQVVDKSTRGAHIEHGVVTRMLQRPLCQRGRNSFCLPGGCWRTEEHVLTGQNPWNCSALDFSEATVMAEERAPGTRK